MAVNKVDYDVLTSAVKVYGDQASAINDSITALISMNGDLADGWTNQTASAFLERFEDEYRPALEEIRDAVQSISDYIQNYMQNKMDDDSAGAAAVRG